MADQSLFVASPGAINVIAGNPGLAFNAAQLSAISTGVLVLSNPLGFQPQCITHLRYQDNDKDLQQISLSNGTVYTNADITNLKDFRERLQEAANFGHGVTFCVDTREKRMFMLNIFPCKCNCSGKKEG